MSFADDALLTLAIGVEGFERLEQSRVTSSFTQLPINGPREVMEKLGFVFGEPIDKLFVSITSPDGWVVERTDHSMWSNIKDPKGNIRGSMFYKGAIYDRDAFYHLKNRYTLSCEYEKDPPQHEVEVEKWFDVTDRYHEFEVPKPNKKDEVRELFFYNDYEGLFISHEMGDFRLGGSFKTRKKIVKRKVKALEYVTAPKEWREKMSVATIVDNMTSKVLYRANPAKNGTKTSDAMRNLGYYSVSDMRDTHCRIWLKRNFPNSSDPLAYW